MLRQFFAIAMLAPGRQRSFRRLVIAHVIFIALLAWQLATPAETSGLTTFGYILLCMAMVEGAALVGWRLTQLPKSQALEFLLVSPAQPKGVFVAEAAVGVSRFALVWLAGLPVFAGLLAAGSISPADFWPLVVFPFVWGVAAALALTAWVYEPIGVRRIGEVIALLGVLVYLTVGVLAGEHLVLWLQSLPDWLAKVLYDCVIFFHEMNPFGIVRYWFTPDAVDWIARERVIAVTIAGVLLTLLACGRAAFRLRGHFHDRHYKPLEVGQVSDREQIGDRPLSWWAVKRVMEYSGRVNLWLAGGFAVMYATYIVAGDHWPAWMGKLVFQIFETWGGAATVATALAVMAAVPAVFQYGLWDSTIPARCKRLELLLLTDLTSLDYWHASLSAAWKRGRGYLFAAGLLWLALGISGRATWPGAIGAMLGGCVLWAISFAIGFRAFATGNQTSGLASIFTLGLPLLLVALYRANLTAYAGLVPAGLCHLPVTVGLNASWFVGLVVTSASAIWLTRTGLRCCDADLRCWYDANQGQKAAA